ncbi:MAG: hypothetical protein ACQETX_08815 [Pseudomonadota bacterium]
MSSMTAAGYVVHEENPFDDSGHAKLNNKRAVAPAVTRIKNMWAKMSRDVLGSIEIRIEAAERHRRLYG